MKVRTVLAHCVIVGALLAPSRATAQVEDDFVDGFDISLPWTFNVPGNNPGNTEDPANYAFSPNSIDITAQPGSLYGANNNARNIPSLVVYAQPTHWYVEIAVSTDWSMAATDAYVHGGMIFLADADNYFSYYHNRNANPDHTPRVQVSSTLEVAGNSSYGGISSVDWSPTQDVVRLRIEGGPSQISFLYKRPGAPFIETGSATPTSNSSVFTFLSSLVGKQVGLETDTGGGFNNSPFSFAYFKTNLVVSPYEDDFANAFNLALPWTFNVAGNNPPNTEDQTQYAFSPSSLDITAQAGSLYAANNNAHNIPSFVVLAQPDNWYVETAVRTDWSMASVDKYVHAGLVFLADADNYFSFYNNRNADPAHTPLVQVSSTVELGGNPQYGGISSLDWQPTQDYVRLLVKGTPTDVTFYFNHTGTWEKALGQVSATDQPDLFAFLSSLVGKQVGLETDTGGGFNSSPFSFHYFRTNLKVAP
jgi:hypothetical protein